MKNAPIVEMGNYNYYVFPITDGVPMLQPDIIKEIVSEAMGRMDLDVDRIVTVESMGIPLATALSAETGIPFTTVRKRSYGLKGEVMVTQRTGYSESTLYINGLQPGMKVAIIDDIVSTGGTLIALIDALNNMNVEIVDTLMVVDKGRGRQRVMETTGIDVKCLVRVDEKGGPGEKELVLRAIPKD